MNDWHKWIREIAYDRIDQIERNLNASPDAYPVFAAAAGKLDAAMDETDANPDAKLTERDCYLCFKPEIRMLRMKRLPKLKKEYEN